MVLGEPIFGESQNGSMFSCFGSKDIVQSSLRVVKTMHAIKLETIL